MNAANAPQSNAADEMSPFDNFQLEEYKNISNSHYESVQQLSVFFRYYLVILAAPAFIITLVTGVGNSPNTFFSGEAAPSIYNIVFFYFNVVAIAGFCLYVYVINVRFDAILYARAVNNVRRYFYEKSKLKATEYNRYLTLPLVPTRPKYVEKTFFVPLLVLFATVDCSLTAASFYLKLLNSKFIGSWILNFNLPITTALIYVVSTILFVGHIAAYVYLAYRRNNYYLKSYSIGVDIDGVLNTQTQHFVEWLKKLTGKVINPNDIKEIPVQLNSSIGVSDFDEKVVFNTREYWETLPFREKASIRINDFHKKFGYNIMFFSYRDWPQYGSKEVDIKNKIKAANCTPLKKGDIHNITSKWMKDGGIEASVVSGRMSSLKYSLQRMTIPDQTEPPIPD